MTARRRLPRGLRPRLLLALLLTSAVTLGIAATVLLSPLPDRLRQQSPSFEHLPEEIELPPVGMRRTRIAKALLAATLDDVALAILDLREHAGRIDSRIYALKRLHDRATAGGAVGATRVGDLPPLPPRLG